MPVKATLCETLVDKSHALDHTPRDPPISYVHMYISVDWGRKWMGECGVGMGDEVGTWH